MSKRCAVVIGVSTTGGLKKLASPISGAHSVADFFKGNGYDVTLLTDENGAVTATQISTAVRAYLDKQQEIGYDLLAIYFSGHGNWLLQSDVWLLSGAPEDVNEAVSLRETADIARDCGIPTVVLISDACRSATDDPNAARVRGSVIFPNRRAPVESKVDQMKGSREGNPSYEVELPGIGWESAFTHCLLKAFHAPDAGMLASVTEHGETFNVVPNRQLEKFVIREMPQLFARLKKLKYEQVPHFAVVSHDLVYMARAGGPATKKANPPPEVVKVNKAVERAFGVSGSAVAEAFLNEALDRAMEFQVPIIVPETPAQPDIRRKARLSNRRIRKSFRDDVPRVADNVRGLIAHLQVGASGPVAVAVPRVQTGTGFTVKGASIRAVTALETRGVEIRVTRHTSASADVITVVLPADSMAVSLLAELHSGSFVPLAALRGYIGHLAITNDCIRSMAYLPSQPSQDAAGQPDRQHDWMIENRWDTFMQSSEKLERLRALAAQSMSQRGFRVGDPVRARRLAEVIRSVKGADPILGVLSMYAYDEAGHYEDRDSVRNIMQHDLQVDLFDAGLLCRSRQEDAAWGPVVPFCPLLSQGWNLLRSRKVPLHPEVDKAWSGVTRSAWTMFNANTGRRLLRALDMTNGG